MTCPSCRQENPERAKFCLECGTRLAAACPQCGTELVPGAKFCLECGHRLAPDTAAVPAAPTETPRAAGQAPGGRAQGAPGAYTPKHLADKILGSRSAIEGERRQVTVLFADLAGFTALAERLDPEDVHGIIERCFEVITAEVHRLEGAINQYTGDGVMALFGAPIAHEDAPRRAVHAALGIQRALRELSQTLSQRGGPTLRMRIGLNTGPVVVGKIGDDLRMDYTAVGDTTNLAARLQQQARPGAVLVSEATHRAVAGYFETLDHGELAVKGRAPVHAFEVVRPRGRRSRLEVAAERGLTPLVGRVRELATLADLFDQAKAGRGQVVLLAGEAGIGKSRLLLELRRTLAERGEDVTWIEGQCVSFGQAIPFLPLIDQLRRNFGIEEFDGEPEIIAKVEHGMRRMGELEPHIPFVRYLLAVDPGDPAVAAMEASPRRERVFEALRALALRGARIRPIILVVEDLHWADASSDEYLRWLMDSVAGVPVMLVLTHRPGSAPAFPTRSFLTALTLQPLSAADAASVVARVLDVDAVSAEVLAAIMDKAEGVPLFVEEVTKTLLDLGVLRRENDAYRLVPETAGVSVPDTIQGIIMARLDRLGDQGKRTVQLASVIGRQFLVRLLERIAEFRGELDGVLRELRRLEIVYELGLLPEPAYVFKHAVIQDVAYESLLVQRRKELHRAVGYAIEQLYADRLADHLEELAHHFSLGEEWSKAFDYLVRSGERAAFAYANAPAADAYARALEIAPRVEPPVPAERLVDIRLRRSELCATSARLDEAIGEAEQAVALARAAGSRRAEARALTGLAFAHFLTVSAEHVEPARIAVAEARAIAAEAGDAESLCWSLYLDGALEQVDGRLVSSDRRYGDAIQMGRELGLRTVVVRAGAQAASNVYWRGDFRAGIEANRRASAAAREAHDGFYELFSLSFTCLAHIALGEHAEALALITDGMGRARDRGNMFIVGRLINSLGWLHQELGDFGRALESDRESVEIAHGIKNGNVEISALINVGYDHLHLGEPGRALEILEQAQRRAEKGFGAHSWRWDLRVSTSIAETLLALGRPEAAMPLIARADAGARATGSAKYLARCHLLRGEVALGGGQLERAERELDEALRIAQRLGYPTGTWQAAHALAQALAASPGGRDRRERAHEMARLAASTIESIAGRLPDPALSAAFLGWAKVRAVQDTLERLRRG